MHFDKDWWRLRLGEPVQCFAGPFGPDTLRRFLWHSFLTMCHPDRPHLRTGTNVRHHGGRRPRSRSAACPLWFSWPWRTMLRSHRGVEAVVVNAAEVVVDSTDLALDELRLQPQSAPERGGDSPAPGHPDCRGYYAKGPPPNVYPTWAIDHWCSASS